MTPRKAHILKPAAEWMVTVIAAVLVTGLIAAQPALAEEHGDECSVAALHGTYIFDASGFINMSTGWTPKAVVEFLHFNGDGTLTSVATADIGGHQPVSFFQGTGTYSVDENC